MGMVEISASPVRILAAILPVVHAQIIVADGQGSHAAAGADALLAGDHGNTGGHQDVGDGLGVGGGGVVGGDVDHIAAQSAGRLGHGGDVVGVGEGELLVQVIALVGQVGLDRLLIW